MTATPTTPLELTPLADDLFCPDCGYDLRGGSHGRCPECGAAIDLARAAEARIPWANRKSLGRVRAYGRTVMLATFRPAKLAREVSRPVYFADAVRFRRVTVAIAFVPLAICLLVVGWRMTPFAAVGALIQRPPTLVSMNSILGRSNDWELWSSHRDAFAGSEIVLYVGAVASVALFLQAISGVASYFFHPRALPVIRQNRAVAVSYYACAPLAWTPFSIGLIVLTLTMSMLPGDWEAISALLLKPAWIVSGTVLLLHLLACWIVPVRMLAVATHCGPARAWALALALPILDLLLASLILVGIPLILALVLVAISSFT